MKLRTILLLCALVVQKVAAASEEEGGNTPDSSDHESSGVVSTTQSPSNSCGSQESNKFYGDLYQAVKKSQPANFILSPLSVRNALAMLSLGAMGETAEEIQQLLQLPGDASELISNQSQLIAPLNEISSPTSGLKFVTGDAVFTNSKIRVYQKFKDQVTALGGETERVNFGNGEPAAGRINGWVSRKTEGKIEKVVEPSDLNDQISLLLLNTIYFKGLWNSTFEKVHTKPRPFFINGSCSVSVDMMYQQNEFQLADLEDANAQVILLPYQGERLSMMIYLPFGKEESSLEFLEAWLKNKSPFDIQKEHLSENELSKTSVFLPKFKFRSSLELKKPLKKLGLKKMFDMSSANFSGIFNDSRNFFVSKVFQETFIEVNEEGTEAAAATGAGVAATSVSSDFRADRPFLFQIVDSQTQTVLFSGRVKNPLDSVDSSDGNWECIEVSRDPMRRCVPKPEVEEMLGDFANFLVPNETEANGIGIGDGDSGLQVLMGKYENETRGTLDFIERMNRTLEKLEKTEKEFEESDKTQGQRIRELEEERDGLKRNLTTSIQGKDNKIRELEMERDGLRRTVGQLRSNISSLNQENQHLRDTPSQQPTGCPREDDAKGHYVSFPRAAARVFECTDYNCRPAWEYNATVYGTCGSFGRGQIRSVQLTGSCVTLYESDWCEGKSFQLNRTNEEKGRDIEKQFPHKYFYSYNKPKSIGTC